MMTYGLRKTTEELNHLFYIKSLFVMFVLVVLPIHAQVGQQLHSVNEHFLGRWSGTNHDYTQKNVVKTNVSVEVTRHRGKERLDMKYTYVEEGKTQRKIYKRYWIIEPVSDSVFINRGRFGKEHLRLEGLHDLLRDGYGDFTAIGDAFYEGDRHAPERIDFHLFPEEWSYEIYLASNGGPFVKTGDWAMRRITATSNGNSGRLGP